MPTKCQMWLTFDGEKDKIRFPVLPDTISVKSGGSDKSVSVAGLGEVVIKGDPAAVVISFNCFFPATEFPGVQYSPLVEPRELVNKITTWKNSDKPVHFIVTEIDVNMFCAIQDFTETDKGGDVDAVYYAITLKEYKEVAARQIKVENQKAVIPDSKPERSDNRQQPQTYTVVKGDCLWNIAKKYLGSGSRYGEIADLNKDIIKSPNLIMPGMVLKLPEK